MNRKRWPFLLVGLISQAVFIGTGVYLMAIWTQLEQMPPAERLTNRSNHVYILFASLINLAAAGTTRMSASGWRKWAQTAGAWLILLSPLLTTFAFFVERSNTSPYRPWTMIAIFATTFGVFAFAAGRNIASPAIDESRD